MNYHQEKLNQLKSEYFIYGVLTAFLIIGLFLILNGTLLLK